MKPDYDRAATEAMKILVAHKITETPIVTMPILKNYPGVRVMSFTHMANEAGINRDDLIPLFNKNQDAVTFHLGMGIEDVKYVVVYNMRLPHEIICRALARELAHIVLGHDGSKPENVRNEEARCFAKHLLIPRPLIHAIQATNIRITTEVMNNLTGCNDHCLACIRKLPPVHVSADLNRLVRDQFMPYIVNYFNFQRHAEMLDGSALADLGTYMDGYEE